MEGDGLEALLAELESEVACSQALGESPPGGHAALGAGWAAAGPRAGKPPSGGGLRNATERALLPQQGIDAEQGEHSEGNIDGTVILAAPSWLSERQKQMMREGWRQSQLDLRLSALSCAGDITGRVGDLGSPPSSPCRRPASPFLRTPTKIELDSAQRQVDAEMALVHRGYREQRQIRCAASAGDEFGHGGTAYTPSTGYMQIADSVPTRPNYRQIGTERRTQLNRERYEQSLPPLQRYGRRAATRLYSWLFPRAQSLEPASPPVSSRRASAQRCPGIEDKSQNSQAKPLSAETLGMCPDASGKACCPAPDSVEELSLELERMLSGMSASSIATASDCSETETASMDERVGSEGGEGGHEREVGEDCAVRDSQASTTMRACSKALASPPVDANASRGGGSDAFLRGGSQVVVHGGSEVVGREMRDAGPSVPKLKLAHERMRSGDECRELGVSYGRSRDAQENVQNDVLESPMRR